MITVEKEISELSKVSIVYNEARKINFSLFKNKLSKYNEIYFDLIAKCSVQEINFLLNRNLISLSDNIKAKFRVLCLSQYMTSYRESNIYSFGLQYSDNFKDDFKIDYQDLMILFKLNLKVDYKILRTLYFLKCIKNTPLSKRFFYFLKLKRYTIINSKSLSYDKQRKISKFNEFLESEKYKKHY